MNNKLHKCLLIHQQNDENATLSSQNEIKVDYIYILKTYSWSSCIRFISAGYYKEKNCLSS